MQFFSFGLNHHAASVGQRDAFVFDDSSLRALYRSVDCSNRAEFVVVSTCNRTECYLYGTDSDVQNVRAGISTLAGKAWPAEQAFQLHDEDAVKHLLEVTAGLDSMVIGDAQILGQVKEAYRVAVEEERVAAVLHRLMHTAFATAKRVLNETDIATGHASVAGTAASIVKNVLEERLTLGGEAMVVVVGAGQMGRLVAEALGSDERIRVSITNRSCERLDEFAERNPRVLTIPWNERYRSIAEAHAVVVASAADSYTIEKNELQTGSKRTDDLLLVDLSIPRNIDPQIDSLPGYNLLDLDALQQMIEEVIDLRKMDLQPAQNICDEMLADFVSWFFHHQALQPAIHAILETFDSIRLQEIERHQHRFNEADFNQLDRITKSIMQKVLAVPVVRLKNVGPDHIDYVNGIKLLQVLFARTSCEDPVTSNLEVSDSILDALSDPENARLSTLAVCPFDEAASPQEQEKCPVPHDISQRTAVVLGTRKSALAMWQATHVKTKLEIAGCNVDIQKMTTRGDQILDKPLVEIEGKSLFTRELDRAIMDGRIDIAVHSLKDLPSELPRELVLAAITERENPFDVFIAHPSFEGSLEELPPGARIGTSSLRRTAQLKAWRPDLEIVPVRGNVDTRISKLDDSDWHGIVLAAAGLIRLGREDRIHAQFDPRIMLPAVGQGALGIVCAKENKAIYHTLRSVLHDERTASCVLSERAFLRTLEGSCRAPVGALADWNAEGIQVLEGFVGSIDGSKIIRDSILVNPNEPEESGVQLATRLLENGAEELLQMIRII